MKQVILISIICCTCFLHSFGQTALAEKISHAYSFYDNKQYDSSFKYFNELKKEISIQDTAFRHIAFGITASIYFQETIAKNSEDWIRTEKLANSFLNALEEYKNFIQEGLVEKKYFAYKDLVVANFGLGKKDEAKFFQQKLYDAYKNKELPDGINEYYNFQKFTWNKLNVWAYEWYPNLGDKETEGSFSKQVYYIYSTDEKGADKDQLFRLHTIKIHKLTPDEPKVDYVLTFRKTGKEGNEASRTLWDHTFKNPINYEDLHKAVIEFLEKNKSQILEMVKPR